MSIKTETVWKKFANCSEITLSISNTQKMQKQFRYLPSQGRYSERLSWLYTILEASYAYSNESLNE